MLGFLSIHPFGASRYTRSAVRGSRDRALEGVRFGRQVRDLSMEADMRMIRFSARVLAGVGVLCWCASLEAAGVSELLNSILAIDHEGQGAPAAQKALKELVTAEASSLPAILKAFDRANPLAANYLRSAVETICSRTTKNGGKLPVAELQTFVADRQRDPRARSLAFEQLKRADASVAAGLVPAMINDPSPELRREAVGRLTTMGLDEKDEAAKVAHFEAALSGAVDDDQVKSLVEQLKKLGKTVDLQQHFGFLTKWNIVGPFDNKETKGFPVSYPPEENGDLKATYKGQLGDVTWGEISTTNDYGILDIAKDVKPYKGAVMYLTTDFVSDKAQAVELRLGTPNAWKVWVNGKLLFAREEYHRGMALDQYRVPTQFRAGKNTILVKLCQNEQDQDWAQRYQLQLRVCDASGSAVHPAEPVKTTATP